MTTTTENKMTFAETMNRYGLISCDFVVTAKNGVESISVYAAGSEEGVQTTLTPLFDYGNEQQVAAINEICEAVADKVSADITNVVEVGGTFAVDGDEIEFQGDVTTVVQGVYTTLN